MENLTVREQQLFKKLHEQRSHDIETFNRPEYHGIWESIVEKYPETAHFVYELIQNADDAEATYADFILFSDGLVFKHNGKRHFNITEGAKDENSKIGDINSICAIGFSTKSSSNKIGKFGVGFKSVFQYTESPEIYDDKFKFKIENYFVPTLLNHDHKLRKKGETLFYLKFKDRDHNYQHIKERLQNLSSPILFLNHLNTISWQDTCEQETLKRTYQKKIKESFTKNQIKCDYISQDYGNQKQFLYLFSRKIEVPNEGKHKICVGYYLTPDKKKIDTSIRPKVFCFFETKDTIGDYCFIVHAPFETTDNRANLKESKINDILLDELCKLAADAIILIKDVSLKNGFMLLDDNIFSLFPFRKAYDDDSYFWHKPSLSKSDERLYNYFTSVIKNNNLLISTENKYCSTSDIRIAGGSKKEMKEILSLLTPKQLRSLFNDNRLVWLGIDEYSRDDEYLMFYLENELSIKVISSHDIAKKLNPQFLNRQTKSWIDSLMDYIKRDWINKTNLNHEPAFKNSCFVKDSEGNWLKPFTDDNVPNVYLPISEGTKSELKNGNYHYIDTRLYQKHSDLWERIGLKHPNIVDVLLHNLLPKYTNDKSIDDKVLQNDFSLLLKIMHNEEYKEQHQEIIKALKEKYLVLGQNLKGESFPLHPYEIYDDCQEIKMFYHEVNDVFFFDYDFYMQSDKIHTRENISSLLREIGVKSTLHINQIQIFNREKEYLEYYNKLISSKIEKQLKYIEYIMDWDIEHLDSAFLTQETSHYLWSFLCEEKSITEKMIAIVLYMTKFAKTHRDIKVPSKLKTYLSDTPWIFKKDGTKCRPTEISADEFISYGYQHHEKLMRELDFGRDNTIRQKETAQKLGKELLDCCGGDEERAKNAIQKLVHRDIDDDNQETNNLETNKIRQAIHYIGLRIYEIYLQDKLHMPYELADNSEVGYDLCKNSNQYVAISAVEKSIRQYASPIYITRSQHQFMSRQGTSRYLIVRISLKDLEIDIEKYKELYSYDLDPSSNVDLKQACDWLAKEYWKTASVHDFESATPVYSINIVKTE